ncbi:MAG: SDR family NAD(P)-dependent oxidoreductase [Kofleriaceae bacterium]
MEIKTILITGANAGLGKESARQLALLDQTERIYLGCRNPERGEAARRELEQATGKSRFTVVPLDTTDLASVRAAVAALPGPVDGLILNAGGVVGANSGDKTADGATLMFATNVLGHAALVDELLRAGKLTKVVVYAGSEAACGVKAMRMKRPSFKSNSVDELASVIDGSYFDEGADSMQTYGPTKYIAALWMSAMARKHPEVRFITMSPGGTAGTNLADTLSGGQAFMMKYLAMPMMRLFGAMHGLEDGGKRYVTALTDPRFPSGSFWGSPSGKMTGELVDQSTIFADLANPRFQDNAHEAIHRFLR